jgi:hypothetical protein
LISRIESSRIVTLDEGEVEQALLDYIQEHHQPQIAVEAAETEMRFSGSDTPTVTVTLTFKEVGGG